MNNSKNMMNIKNMNNVKNNMFKNIKKYLPEEKHNYFFILIAIIVVILFILILRNYYHSASMYERYVKNVFFREMDNLKGRPLDVSGSNFDICIQGKTSKNQSISNKFLHIKSDYLLMFWVRLESEKISDYINNEYKNINLVNFSKGTFNYPRFEISNLMENTMSVYVGNGSEPIGELYNIPYDEWFCISAYVTNNHMDVYINGKLVKIFDYSIKLNNLTEYEMKIGNYPGSIAYLQVNNDSSYFNPNSIYKEYLVYKEFIKRFMNNEYHNEYEISKLRIPNRHENHHDRRVNKRNNKNVCIN